MEIRRTSGGVLVIDPTGRKSGSRRVYRGGCWCLVVADCQAAYRYGYEPLLRVNYLGLRLARIIQLRK